MPNITVYPDLIVPKRVIAAGLKGRLMRQNERVRQISGHMQINAQWEQSLREYEFGVIPMSLTAWKDIETLHEITRGGAYGMLLEDPKDSVVATSVTAWGMTASLGSNQYQLYRRLKHTASGRYQDRKITRPSATGFALMVSGVPLDGQGSPSAYTLDTTTGIVTIPSGPSVADVTWTGSFYVPVHFMDDTIDWTMVRPGSDADDRLFAGPSVVLQEIRE